MKEGNRMTLMINGKKVLGYAIGGNEFHSLDKNADGSITYNGQKYIDLANASLNITMISSTLAGSDGFSDVNSTLSNFENFSEYSFYQIRVLDTDSSDRLDDFTRPFSIKPNVRMSISTDTASLTINVLADNSGINISFTCTDPATETVKIILYGYK